MKLFSKIGKPAGVLLGGILVLVLAGSIPALAVPADQVFSTLIGKTISGQCCFSFDDNVKVTEPAAVVPVIVTWSAEYMSGATVWAGLSVNGRPCIAYGSRSLQPYWPGTSHPRTITLQWVIKPSDGLVQGSNTFTVCGGTPPPDDNHAVILGMRTLTVQLGK